jgi:hypothetical protein
MKPAAEIQMFRSFDEILFYPPRPVTNRVKR